MNLKSLTLHQSYSVTVIQVDAKDYSRKYQQLGNRVQDRVDRDFLRMKVIAQHFGGAASDFRGDSIKMYFPSPDAAVAAGLTIQHELRHRVGDNLTDSGLILYRLGIATGPIARFANPVDPDGPPVLNGPVVNRVSRIEKYCVPGEIFLCGDTVHGLRAELKCFLANLGVRRYDGNMQFETYASRLHPHWEAKPTDFETREENRASQRQALMDANQRANRAYRLQSMVVGLLAVMGLVCVVLGLVR